MATSKLQADKTLLWTNPNATASFTAQTIAIDLSGYNEIEIEWGHDTNNPDLILFDKIKVTAKGYLFTVRGQPFYTQWRQVDTSASSVSFADCTMGSGAIYNNHVIPLKIYGIK